MSTRTNKGHSKDLEANPEIPKPSHMDFPESEAPHRNDGIGGRASLLIKHQAPLHQRGMLPLFLGPEAASSGRCARQGVGKLPADRAPSSSLYYLYAAKRECPDDSVVVRVLLVQGGLFLLLATAWLLMLTPRPNRLD